MADKTAVLGFGDPAEIEEGKAPERPGELHLVIGRKPETVPEKMSEGSPGAGGVPSAGSTQPNSGPNSNDKAALLGEAERRGLLSPETRQLYLEAQKRGLIPGPMNLREIKERSAKDQPIPGAPEVDQNLMQEAIRDPRGIAAKVMTGAQKNLQARHDAVVAMARHMRGFADDVDYESGLSWDAKMAIKDADNPTEAERGLTRLYPTANIGQDEGGRWWVQPKGGKKVSVFPDTVGGKVSELGAGFFAATPETAGSVAGGTIGAGIGPGGAAVGAGVGGAIGKGMSEARKAVTGVLSKTPEEEARTIGTSGLINLGGEGVARGLSGAGHGTAGALRGGFFEVTPESRAMTENLLASGARPPMLTVAPGAKSMQWHQALRNIVKGDPQHDLNVEFSRQRILQMLKLADVPDHEIQEVFASIIDPRRAVSLRGEGEVLAGSVKNHVSGLEREAAASLQTAKDIVTQQGAVLEQMARQSDTTAVHEAFVSAVRSSRRDFGTAMSRVYDDINAMTGGAAIVPTAAMKSVAQDIIGLLPASNMPTIFHEIVGLPNTITIANAQRLRTRLREAADSGNLTPGTVNHDYSEAAGAVDGSMSPDGIVDQRSMPAEALRALRAADAQYAEGIAVYRDTKMNQMVRDFRNQKVLDAEKFAASLFDTRSSFRVASMRQVVGDNVWRQVQAADTLNMLKSARRLASDGMSETRIDGQALYMVLNARGQMLDSIYGKGTADVWREYAARLAAIDGKIEASALRPDMFAQSLAEAVAKREQLEDFVKNDALRVLQRGGPEEVDAAVNTLVRPGQEAQLDHVLRFFGDNSDEVAAIRSAALKKALSQVITSDRTGLKTRISGESIDKFLSQYTRREQEMLFPSGLDRDMRVVADEMKALFPRVTNEIGGSLAGSIIKSGMPWTVLPWLYAAFGGWVADRPAVIRTLAGIQGTPSVVKTLRQATLAALWRQFLNETADNIRSTAQTRQTRGQLVPGNIDLTKRPVVRNGDGSISTVRSMSFEDEKGREVLIPTVSDDGRILSQDDAIALYRRTGRHLGIFDNADDATAYAQALHAQQGRMYVDPRAAPSTRGVMEQRR